VKIAEVKRLPVCFKLNLAR